jgi:hypothetical protein
MKEKGKQDIALLWEKNKREAEKTTHTQKHTLLLVVKYRE